MRDVIETCPGIWSVFAGASRVPEAQFNSQIDAAVYAAGRDVIDDAASRDALNRLKMAIADVEMRRKRFGVQITRMREVAA